MLDAIVCTSRSGHTMRYAKALAEELNLPVYTLKEAKKKLFKQADILYMSWVKKNKVVGYNKTVFFHICGVIAVGITKPSDEYAYELKEYNQIYSKVFYLPGGIKKKRLTLLQRLFLKGVENDLSFQLLQHGLTKDKAYMLDAILHQLDYVDFNNLLPILNSYRQNEEFVS